MSFEGNYHGRCISLGSVLKSERKWNEWLWKWLETVVTSWEWLWVSASSSSCSPPAWASSPVPLAAPARGKMVSWEKKWKKFIRRDENSFDCVVKFLMYFYASCSLWDIFWKVLKVRPRNLENSLISLHSNWIWLSAMPKVIPALPQANAIYITPKWSSLFKRTLTGGQGNYEPKLYNVEPQKLSELIFLPSLYYENIGSSVSKRSFYPFSLFSVIGVLCCLGYFSGFDRI